MSALSHDDFLHDSPFTRLVGDRLRRIRQQKKLSLSEVETSSDSEFKASVLGAYERGERAISVPRLERLARFYGVSIDQLLPRETENQSESRSTEGVSKKLRIDVAKLTSMNGPQFEMLERFLRMIQVQRQDFNGKVITVRGHDTRAIAVMLDVSVDAVGDKLSQLGLLFVPPAG